MDPRNHASFHSISVSREKVGQKGETRNERGRREGGGRWWGGEVIVFDTLGEDGKMKVSCSLRLPNIRVAPDFISSCERIPMIVCPKCR